VSQAELDRAEAEVTLAAADVARAEEGLRRTVIVAPFDGVVGRRDVAPGERIDPTRAITRIVTPGTLTDSNLLEPKRANWLAAVAPGEVGGLAWCDLSTGAFATSAGTVPELAAVLARLGRSEAAERLAPVVRKVIALDREPAMLAAARKRLARFSNVEFRQGDLLSPPLAAGEADLGILMLVVHHMDDPSAVLRALAPGFRKGGALLVVDMASHDRSGYQQTMGHRHLGFSEAEMAGFAAGSGFAVRRHVRLRPDTSGKGPGLFAALLVRT
jgi:SAM-dependent methyltransferase